MHTTWLQSISQHIHSKDLLNNFVLLFFFCVGGCAENCLSAILASAYLCVAVTKSLVAIFVVYDRPNCHHLIPQHIIQNLCQQIFSHSHFPYGLGKRLSSGRMMLNVLINCSFQIFVDEHLVNFIESNTVKSLATLTVKLPA